MKYLRRLQAAGAPAAPGTVLRPDGSAELLASGAPGASVELKLEVENRQRVHCMVTPMLSPLVEASGVTWFPAAEPVQASMLLAPEEVNTLVIRLPLPANIPAGTYRGALLLQGFREGAIAVAVIVSSAPGGTAATTPQPGSARVSPAKPPATATRAQKGKRTRGRRK